jgi:peptidoglycan/LPS O-acetylase OafA/YrhL
MPPISTLWAKGPLRDLLHRPPNQIPALDALRTLAVALVIIYHVTIVYLTNGGQNNVFANFLLVRGGWIGVDLFFVLSGYFIGRQLWGELEKTGSISVRRFLLRRGLRIWPLYYFFLAFVLLVLGRGGGGQGWSDAVFLTNYIQQGVVRGAWSLCIEEQFYIITPLLMLIAMPRLVTLGRFRAYLVGMLILLPLIRALIWWQSTGSLASHDEESVPRLYYPIHTHSDGLIMGLLLSNLETERRAERRAGVDENFFSSGWMVVFAIISGFVLRRIHHEIFNYTSVTLIFGAVVFFLLRRRPRWLVFLDWGGFYVLSRLSFGMYLNHQYMCDKIVDLGLSNLPFSTRMPGFCNGMIALVLFALSIAVSVVTFSLVEYPFLQLRERVLVRHSQSGVDFPTNGERGFKGG